jgi:calcineurin-like phosphoesterase family protein
MPKTFVISDTHFQNSNIIQYCNRPFKNSDDQTLQLIQNWNSVVDHEDTVICLGDFIMGAAENTLDILYRLNGHIILTRGNHDTDKKLAIYAEHPQKITVKDIHYEPHGGMWFICSHFPMTNPEFQSMVIRDNSEVVVLFGHVHDKRQFVDLEDHSFNCSCDVINFTPVNLHDIYNIVKEDFIQKGVWRGKA